MKEYEQYLAVKRSGVPRLLIPLEDGKSYNIFTDLGKKIRFFCVFQQMNIYIFNTDSADTQNNCELELQTAPRVPSLFEHGFFEVHVRLENRVIKANCLTCQRMGRANLIQAREYSSSNLLAHLKVSRTSAIKLCLIWCKTAFDSFLVT